jgi:cytochrome c peroxidase
MHTLCRSKSSFFIAVGFTPKRRIERTRLPALAGTAGVILSAVTLLAALGLVPGVLQAQVQTYTCAAPGFGVVPPGLLFPAPAPVLIAPLLLAPLKTVPNPVLPNGPAGAVRGDLVDYIANQTAAIQLGKALFWDMQAGSDNKTACATCHFKAGGDGRDTNQLNPGANGLWDSPYAPNYTLFSGDFPFTTASRDLDNIAGSQGVRKSAFVGISKKGLESTTPVSDPVFNLGGVNVRQVTGKNTPSTINAVFNHRQFWNGRAQPDFNGVDPFGSRSSARVWVLGNNGSPAQIDIHIQNASLASQAVGPPLNTVEMSAAGRTFPDLGHKLLLARPLGLQGVDPTDSVLGRLADTTRDQGLNVTYASLIQKAFQPKWWNSKKTISLNGKSYTMMEANFSLFWGLSIMLYEATLVSDNTPMDQYLATRVVAVDATTRVPYVASDDPTTLQPLVARLQSDLPGLTVNDILTGLALFELPVGIPPLPKPFPLPDLTSQKTFPSTATYNPDLLLTRGVACSACHFPGELTSATVRNLTGPGVELADAVLKAAGFDLRLERMFMTFPPVPLGTSEISFDPSTYTVNITAMGYNADGTPAAAPPQLARTGTYDAGWYNIGVRPTADDHGLGAMWDGTKWIGGVDPFGNPLSWTQLFQVFAPGLIQVPGNGVPCVANVGGAVVGNVNFPFELVNAAGFPILSGPLLKNEPTDVDGTFKTPGLRNVDLNGPYFHNGGRATLAQVVDFYGNGGNFANDTKAPAIMPLNITPGESNSLLAFLLSLTDERVRFQQAPFDHPQLFVPNGDSPLGTDNMVEIPAVGANGSPTPLQRFLNLNPFSL